MFAITKAHGKINSYAHREFLLSDISDLEKLPRNGIRGTQNNPNDTVADDPCAIGSKAIVCTGYLTEIYILNPENKWIKMFSFKLQDSEDIPENAFLLSNNEAFYLSDGTVFTLSN